MEPVYLFPLLHPESQGLGVRDRFRPPSRPVPLLSDGTHLGTGGPGDMSDHRYLPSPIGFSLVSTGTRSSVVPFSDPCFPTSARTVPESGVSEKIKDRWYPVPGEGFLRNGVG